ncbi:Ig-like domain-containing protein [Sphingorhabdus wooponensis]|uniref:Ig-like domain-containing protein n=1 Tax=Sphingorhabdus wooponensis TaxID=940136 RepID=UPI00163AD991|nr:Ig-like domain-containing protein [Sphingorhabdus wooponensis]
MRTNVKQTKVIDTDLVFVLEDGRTVFIRDGAVQSLLDNGFSVEFSDGAQATGQELLQSAGAAEISSVALTGPQASSNDAVIVAQAPQAVGTSPVAQPSSGGGLRTWLAIGTPLVGGVLGGVLGGGGGSTATATTDTGTTANVKPATPVINVIANDDKVNATEKAGGVSVTGTSEASASVTVNWGSTTKTVTADSTGRWSASFASTEVPADAAGTTVSATLKSAAGISSDPATKTVQIDTTPPAAPVIAAVTGDGIVGPMEKASATGVDINGTAEPGSAVSVSFGEISKTVVADLGGNWSVNYKSSEIPNPGAYAVTATARDANGNTSTAPATSQVTVSAAVNLTGQIVAGPVIVGNGLSVEIYLANGTLLASGVRVNADGTFTATNLPVGPGDVIFAKVVDSTTGADYMDEATGVAVDLNTVLLAAKVVDSTSVTMHINPLTTIAAIKAGLAADGTGTVANATAATNANTATAQAFGLSGIDITTTSVVATNSGGFTSADGLSSGEKIGAVLAALSGLDSLNGGNSQTTVSAISQLLNVEGNKGQLTDQGQLALMRGAIAAEDKVDGALQGIISDGVAASAPTATQVTINSIATDNIITAGEVANLTITGTVSSGATGVSLLFGSRTAAATVNGSEWSYALTEADITALGADGAKVIQAQAALSNTAPVTASRLVTLKVAPPATPSLNAVSGDNAINGAEKAAGVAFAGTGEAGSTVVLIFGGVTKTALVDTAGTWTTPFLASEIPADGSATVSVSARDAFGNSSGTVTRPITIDTVAPGLPTIRSVTGDDLIGPTEKLGGVQILGTADALANIRLTFGNLVRTTTADASGNWSVNLLSSQVPEDGEYAVAVTQSDAAGNSSSEVTRTVRVDAQPPAKPVILPVATDNIINAAEKLNGVSIRGTAEPNVSLELTWGTISRTIRVAANGTWSASFTGAQIPADGTANISAIATDSSGNVSEPGIRTVTIDSLSQDLTIASVATDNVINAAEKAVNVTVTGQAEPGANIVVTLGGTTRNALANQNGTWVVNFTTAEIPADTDVTTVTAQSTDQAGNISGLVGRDIRIDTAIPNAPVINIVSGDDAINADEATSSVEVTGTAEAFALVTVTWGTASRTANADADGIWRTTFASSQIPPEGASVLTATARDSALNFSVARERPILIDIGTARPVINSIAGNDVINATERNNGVLVSGTAEAGATVRLVWGTVVKSPVAGTDGTWSQLFIASEIPLSGNSSISASPTDRFGNIGAAQTRNFSIDTTVSPAAFNNVTGADNIVNASEKSLGVQVTGTAEAGSEVLVTWGTTVKSITTDAAGVWATFFTDAQIPSDGATTITAVVTDLAGNVSVQSGQPVTIDTTAPVAPIVTLPIAGDNVINNSERTAGVVVSGTSEANADVTIAWGTTSSQTVRADSSGVWSATFASAQIHAVGSATISVTQRDVAGNTGPAATATVVVNTGAPNAPVLDAVATNNIVNAVEKAAGVTISGTALGLSTVSVNWGITKTVMANLDGSWSVNFAAGEVPADGSRTVAVFQTDTLGNVSPTTSRAITVDTAPPAVPVITTPIAGNDIINATEKNATVTISGTAPNSTAVEVRMGGVVKPVTSSGTGTWSVTFASGEIPADATDVLIEARTIDTAGNPSAWVGKSVAIDTAAPATPVISTVAGDDLINATERGGNITVNGTAEANAAVRVTWNGFVRNVNANSSGIWSATYVSSELPSDGSSIITARATDLAGNANAVDATRSVTTLTSPPALPVINQVATDDRINIAERSAGITVTGTASANASVAVTFGTTTHVVNANGSGVWSADFTTSQIAAEGLTRPITAVQTDVNGNVSGTRTRNVEVDLTAPTNLVINQTGGTDLTINAAEKAASVLVSGITDAGNKVFVNWGGVGKEVTSTNGTWSVNYAAGEVPADAAVSTIRVTAQDEAGNISSEVTQNVTIDATAPAAPVINIVSDNDKVNATEAASAITISGTAEANAKVTLRWGNTTARVLDADANGNWSSIYLSTALPAEGISAVTATQTDVAGNSSGQASRSVEIDTVLPATPAITGMSNDYGIYGDFTTDRNAVVLTGTGVANGQIELFINGTSIGLATVDSAGLWESPVINLAALSFGSSLTASARAYDPAGNQSATDASQVITKQALGAMTIDLALLTSAVGFSFVGASADDRINATLATGDIGGDSHKDLIFNSPFMDATNVTNTGGVTVVYGRANWNNVGTFDLANLGTNGWVLRSTVGNDQLGHGGSGVIGDLNGDGKGELIAGAILAENGALADAGAAYIVFGSATPLGTPVTTGANTRYILDTTQITPSMGFVIRGLQAGEFLGGATLGISSRPGANSDFNGDGISDFFIASRIFDRLPVGSQTFAVDTGAVMVVFGQASGVYGTLNATSGQQEMTIDDLTGLDKGFIIRGAAAGDSAGWNIASAGDMNGDGVTDLLVTARLVDRPLFPSAGAAYVIYGKKTTTGQTWGSLIDDPAMAGRKILDLGTLQASDGFMMWGELQNGEFGRVAEGLGDVNGDGFDDIVVSAPTSSVNGFLQSGKAFVIFGSATGQGDISNGRQILSIPAMTSSQGFVIQGATETSALLGNSVGAAGDVNGDGLADIMVAVPNLDRGATGDVGRAYIILGKNNGEGWGQSVGDQSILDLANFGVGDGFSILGRNVAGEKIGDNGIGDSSLISPGDLNGDGLDDLFINAFNGDLPGRTNPGEGYFIYGSRAYGGGLSLTGSTAGNALGGGGLADVIDGQGGADRLRGFGGNDTLIIGDANFVRVDGGTGTDTLRLAGPTGFGLNLSTLAAGAIKDIEQIDLVAGSLNNTLTVTQQTLLDLSSTSDLLKVFGDSGDTVNATGFVTGGSQTENGITYNVYTNGSATLWVQDGVVVNTPAQSGFIAPTISWAEHAVLAA